MFERTRHTRISRFLCPVLVFWPAALLSTRVLPAAPVPLQLNELEYFEKPGLNVLVFSNQYNGMFFDEKTAGIELIHHGVRTATGGAVRVRHTPEQWDQIPEVKERRVDRESNRIEVVLRYADFEFEPRLVVEPDEEGFRIAVWLDRPLPERLVGRAGLNLEFLPATYFEKTYVMDSTPGILPLYPEGPVEMRLAAALIPQFAGHNTFDDRGRGEFPEPLPVAAGRRLILAPEDPERRVDIHSNGGDLLLFDGRNVAQNGWFVVRTLLPAESNGKVVEWSVRPHTIPDWKRPPNIAFSQVGYHPQQKKVAVIELDKNDTPLDSAVLLEIAPSGERVEAFRAALQSWGRYLRYNYAIFDFSELRKSGTYCLRYGDVESGAFPIHDRVYSGIWHPTLDVFFPVQMDHMFVNEAYRVWHGAAHLDDARQAPVNHQHFDGYRMGPSTETPYEPGEHIPGLAVGGWFDAGDFDIQTPSHCATVHSLAETWRLFRPERDQTLIDQDRRFVEIRHPDGKPDILQQIEHGVLQLVAQHRVFGRAVTGIVDPLLHQYHHLGDAVTQTDGKIYDPGLKPYEVQGDRSGTPDDRWVFTNRSAAVNYFSIAALAAAAEALRGYNDPLAAECLERARAAWQAELEQAEASAPASGWEAAMRQGAELSAALELFRVTGEKAYGDRFQELLWPALERSLGRTLATGVRAVPFFDAAFRERLKPYVERYREEMANTERENPFGVPITRGGWAGNSAVVGFSMTAYYLHREFPEVIDAEPVLRGLNYLFGCHPATNTSFVSGVGGRSKNIAYGNNRADFSFIAGGVVPGVLILKPDFPENKDDWPFLWGQNEYTIGMSAQYLLLANAVNSLLQR